MRVGILFIFFFFYIAFGCAQSPVFEIELKISTSTEVNVNIKKNNSPFLSKQTDKKGKLVLPKLSYGQLYHITLSKNNMVSKTLVVDTKTNYFDEETDNTTIVMEIDMIKHLDYVSYDIVTKSPVGKMQIDPSTGKLEWENSYNLKRKSEIDLFIEKVNEISEKNKKMYNSWLDSAKIFINNEKYNDALAYLNKAKSMQKTNRLTDLEQALQQGKEKGDYERKMIAKIEHVADSLFTIKELPRALKYYQRVISLEPGHKLATERIEVINGLLVIEPIDPTNRIRKITQEEMIANARNAQEKRISSYQFYQPATYKQIERTFYEHK